MLTAELFTTFLRRILLAFFVVLVMAMVAVNAHGQNAGEVGIYTRLVTVFNGQASTASSGIFQDNGFATNMLFFCNSGFGGSIDMEWSPTGIAPFFPLVTGNYSNDSLCHTLQLGGYWPNLRSTVTRTSGSLSAWYTASASPISFFPAAISSNGPTSPIQCDQFQTSTVIANGTFASLNASSTRGLAVCSFTISFGGTTSVQTDGVQVGYGAVCSGGVFPWFITTTANTPQVLVVTSGFGALFQIPTPATNICVGNHSGASLEIAVSYALL